MEDSPAEELEAVASPAIRLEGAGRRVPAVPVHLDRDLGLRVGMIQPGDETVLVIVDEKLLHRPVEPRPAQQAQHTMLEHALGARTEPGNLERSPELRRAAPATPARCRELTVQPGELAGRDEPAGEQVPHEVREGARAQHAGGVLQRANWARDGHAVADPTLGGLERTGPVHSHPCLCRLLPSVTRAHVDRARRSPALRATRLESVQPRGRGRRRHRRRGREARRERLLVE